MFRAADTSCDSSNITDYWTVQHQKHAYRHHVNKLNGSHFLKRKRHSRIALIFSKRMKCLFFYQRCFKKIFSKKVNSAYLMKRRKNNGNWLTESPIVPWVSGVIDCFLWCWSWGVLVFQCEKVLINAKRKVYSSAYVRWEIDLWCQYKLFTWSGKIAHIDGASKCCWTMKWTTSGVQRDGGSSSLPTTVL